MQPNQELQKPFFAQFLESQASNAQPLTSIVTGRIVDHPGDVTQKFPSDNDEEWDF
ncbi:microviridin/marinostatin family tricyclic proteinase inhibitor [uncultured Chitinophaga sp.]|jgi:Serine endopeptidase inhibitors.|uniref:microviridin/marinostatin family tricyclic proteinase inhibitor n=1 Tax=uncultured Chitinophaga sp. TaxID=339340 RepID=UPI0026088164|nr:microviridin/marinostatin family tricyclic proteinase inhibitor [uncultured Chitinophaga sp.]